MRTPRVVPDARKQFVTHFLSAVVNAPLAPWHPAFIVLDEAYVYAPEGKDEAGSGGAVKALASRGRKRGFCLIPPTQRLAKLSKDVAARLLDDLTAVPAPASGAGPAAPASVGSSARSSRTASFCANPGATRMTPVPVDPPDPILYGTPATRTCPDSWGTQAPREVHRRSAETIDRDEREVSGAGTGAAVHAVRGARGWVRLHGGDQGHFSRGSLWTSSMSVWGWTSRITEDMHAALRAAGIDDTEYKACAARLRGRAPAAVGRCSRF